MTQSKYLTIFEGCDGSGKTTAAKAYAEATGARYVHFSALPRVTTGLARMYVEAMLPALLGYQDVVFDRCWLSENPYGVSFREGQDRLTDSDRRMLERLALRCGALVVMCDPGWELIQSNYLDRKALEMLDDNDQLKSVWSLYREEVTDLPTVSHDYSSGIEFPTTSLASSRTPPHPLSYSSAGNWDADVIIVGDSFAKHKNQDAFYQWPFASFSNEGCSRWLSDILTQADVSEVELLWFNSTDDLSILNSFDEGIKIIALGDVASRELTKKVRTSHNTIPHPQAWKRFHANQRYPLLDLL